MSRTSGAYAYSQKSRTSSGSQVGTTTGPWVTRRISRRPAATSLHWWTLKRVMAASNAPSAKGRASATASTARAALS
ncbi:hypothetical protein [Streptomyces sp. G1]|uniref:hypothetical protein n=1 Tax=Streptomyces sp. G1 TaxID=361572 RepID=UPI00202FA7E8|nr:hypothetical protein [Streptomyces sp. G1]MCM1976679.1 hypothetical protein [Streptomyces sp. G1]